MSYYNRHMRDDIVRESSKHFTGDHEEYEPPSSASLQQEKPSHVMEHLATFTVNRDAGIVHPMDGMRRLLQMEKNTGIWSQKMRLCLDGHCILITDFETGDLIERFPAYLVECPTAFTSDDVMELYNNVLVFIVSAGNNSQSEMHIFQSQSISAVDLVQDIKSLQNNELQRQSKSPVMSSQQYHARREHYALSSNTDNNQFYKNSNESHRYQPNSERVSNTYCLNADTMNVHKDLSPSELNECSRGVSPDAEIGVTIGSRIFEDACSISSEKYEREVNLLNSCFDDIEKFISRLQHTAAAVREVERRRHKKREIGDGLINLHTRPPMEREFIDILAKFKLSFNLLSKLKTHIHDPNAPELVHFLFTPLALIVEAARDTYTETQIAANVIEPLLTRDTINFLINCVSSKETELWKSLGLLWTTPAEEWHEKHNEFSKGRSSHDDLAALNKFETLQAMSRSGPEQIAIEGNHLGRDLDYSQRAQKLPQIQRPNISSSSKYLHDDAAVESTIEPAIPLSEQYAAHNMPHDMFGVEAAELLDGMENETNRRDKIENREEIRRGMDTNIEQWLNELRIKGANAVVVCYPRMANNDKELSVAKGEYLEVLDDTRKWWKARNIHGQVGHVPSTIVAAVHKVKDVSSTRKTYGNYSQNKN